MANLTFDTYGKTRVRLTQVLRNGDTHEVLEISVRILFKGDFAKSYTTGDNSCILPTDTMKNTVYALARKSPITSIDLFAGEVGAALSRSRPASPESEHRGRTNALGPYRGAWNGFRQSGFGMPHRVRNRQSRSRGVWLRHQRSGNFEDG